MQGSVTSGTDIALRQARAARRVRRLFRSERLGRFDRYPIELVRRLVDRRARLIDELDRLEAARRAAGVPRAAELDAALGELAREIGVARQGCEARIERLAAELRERRRPGSVTGLRGGGGRLLGQG